MYMYIYIYMYTYIYIYIYMLQSTHHDDISLRNCHGQFELALRCIAGVLQSVAGAALYCRCVAECCRVLQSVAECCTVLQHSAR